MKQLFTILGIALTAYLDRQKNAHSYQGGAPAGKTGSPGDGGNTCNTSYCHSGPSATDQFITISMQENAPREYTILIEAQSATPFQYTKAGFQACIENGAGVKIGELSTISNTLTKIIFQNYITHKTAGTALNENLVSTHHAWEFNWTASDDFVGEATVYAAVMLTNNNGNNAGDVHIASNYAFNVGVGLDEVNSFDFSVYPNPVAEQINLVFEATLEESTRISLMDMKGSEIVLFEGFLNQKEYSFVLPSMMAPGVYALRIEGDSRRSTRNIIVN